MRLPLCIAGALLLAGLSAAQQESPPVVPAPKVKLGIDVLEATAFAPLAGKRVGLVVHPASVNGQLRRTVDVLHAAANVKLVALFGPEHGVYGDEAAGDEVADKTDERTGLTAYSLYGKTRTPTTQMLAPLDAVVFDLQDLGARSYTNVSTLRRVLDGCVKQDRELIVLDRPNPLGGERIEGGMVKEGYESGVSYIPTPYVHGMTMGELAGLLRDTYHPEFKRLTVVKMQGWNRNMTWADTGLRWTPTSPAIPHAESAAAYVSTGIMGELYAVSIGIGTSLPFQLAGTPTPGQPTPPPEPYQPPRLPGMPQPKEDETPAAVPDDAPTTAPARKKKTLPLPPGVPATVPSPFFVPADTLAERMNALYPAGMAGGVYFQPARWKPASGNLRDIYCQGVLVRLDPHTRENLIEINFRLMRELNARGLLEAAPKRHSMFDKVTGSPVMREAMLGDRDIEEVLAEWRWQSEAFRKSRQKYLLY